MVVKDFEQVFTSLSGWYFTKNVNPKLYHITYKFFLYKLKSKFWCKSFFVLDLNIVKDGKNSYLNNLKM